MLRMPATSNPGFHVAPSVRICRETASESSLLHPLRGDMFRLIAPVSQGTEHRRVLGKIANLSAMSWKPYTGKSGAFKISHERYKAR
jgi:hypothetical protein